MRRAEGRGHLLKRSHVASVVAVAVACVKVVYLGQSHDVGWNENHCGRWRRRKAEHFDRSARSAFSACLEHRPQIEDWSSLP